LASAAGTRPFDIERDAPADQRGRDAAEHEVGVGDGRFVAAVRIAHRPRHGAGAARPDLEMALAADPGDRAAANADGGDVDHRDADGKLPDRTAIGEVRLGAFDQAEIGRGAAGVERHEIGKAGNVRDHRAAQRTGGRPGERGRDRLAQNLLGTRDAAARLHDQERLFAQRPELVVHALEIAIEIRLDESIDQRGHRPLVLAVFRQHGAGQRQHRLGIFLGHDFRHTALMRVVGVGMQQADADRLDLMELEEPSGVAHARLVERPQLFALEIQAAADLTGILQRHQPVRLHPEIGIAIALRHRLTRDFEDMAEALGDDQAERTNIALQEGVGGDGRAVGQPEHIGRAGAR
jgi:hypothetical protein